jgi:hypothetical protein
MPGALANGQYPSSRNGESNTGKEEAKCEVDVFPRSIGELDEWKGCAP